MTDEEGARFMNTEAGQELQRLTAEWNQWREELLRKFIHERAAKWASENQIAPPPGK